MSIATTWARSHRSSIASIRFSHGLNRVESKRSRVGCAHHCQNQSEIIWWAKPTLPLQLLAQARNNLRRVFVIDLPQHLVRQVNAINVPEALRREGALGVRKIFVLGFEEPPIEPHALFGPGAVGAEEDAVLIFQEEAASRERLPAELGDAAGDFDVEIGIAVEPLAHGGQL